MEYLGVSEICWIVHNATTQGSCRIGNRATFSDIRSSFHPQGGYRRNVCRCRLVSDLARAPEGTPAQVALEDHNEAGKLACEYSHNDGRLG
jgi:hypothetical protein